MKFFSIILARGGSKGVPMKNIKFLKGSPLISYSIKASNESKYVDQTWVSSDSDKILDCSKKFGAFTLKRPFAISGDKSSSEEAIEHFCNQINFDHMIFIQPTSPFINSKYIDEAIQLYIDKRYDSIVCVSKIHHNLWINREPMYNLSKREMRQSASNEKFIETGMFYITSKKNFLESKSRISGNVGFYKIPYFHSFEIDSLDDFIFIERIYDIVK